MNRKNQVKVQEFLFIPIPERVLVHKDSRAVVTEVEIRLEVCNNLPAE